MSVASHAAVAASTPASAALSEWSPATRDHLPTRRLRRHPERVALALDDEDGHLHGVELADPARRLGPTAAAA